MYIGATRKKTERTRRGKNGIGNCLEGRKRRKNNSCRGFLRIVCVLRKLRPMVLRSSNNGLYVYSQIEAA